MQASGCSVACKDFITNCTQFVISTEVFMDLRPTQEDENRVEEA